MALGVVPGTIQRMLSGAAAPFNVQVTDIKKIGTDANIRYRVHLSDGTTSVQCMLLAALNSLVASGQIAENCIIEVKNYKVSELKGRQIVILLACSVLSAPGTKLGNPQPAGAASAASAGSAAPRKEAAAAVAARAPVVRATPVVELSPYANRWTIKVRVTKKADVRHFTNARGEGKLFSVELIDESSSEIRATFFGSAVDKFYELIHEQGVYYMSGGVVKPANRKYTSIDNSWEITFGDRTEVSVAADAGAIQRVKFNFTKLHQLPDLPAGRVVDVLGMVKDEGDVVEITTKRGDKLAKRDLTIVDESNTSVQLTLWGDHARSVPGAKDHAIAVKGVKIGDFGGVSLSTTMSATVQLDPSSDIVTRLQGWWESNKDSLAVTSLTTGGGSGSGGGGALTDPTKRKTLAAVEGEGLAHAEDGKGSVFVCKAQLARILVSSQKATPPAYMACTNSVESARGPRSCNKKMTLNGADGFTCESCSISGLPASTGRWRWILPMRVLDHSGAKMVTAFDDEAEVLLGESANDSIARFISMTGANPDGTEGSTEMASGWYESFRRRERVTKYFTLRAKLDTYNDEARVRLTIARVRDVDPLTEAKRLLGVIKAFA